MLEKNNTIGENVLYDAHLNRVDKIKSLLHPVNDFT